MEAFLLGVLKIIYLKVKAYIIYFKDGSYYKGNFKQNKFHRYGKMYWSDGRVYNGLWENGLMNGIGTHIWNNGNFFEGTYI